MNFLQLCQRVRSESGVSSGGPAAVEGQTGMLARLVTWVAEEWVSLQGREDWRFLWRRETPTLTPGLADYDGAALGVPALGRIFARKVYMVHPVTGARQRIGWCSPQGLPAQVAQAGPPRRFTRDPDGKLRFFPAPDLAYGLVLEHLRTPQVLSSNQDVPIIPRADLHAAIVWPALERYARHVGDGTLLANAAAGRQETFSRLYDEYAPKPDATPLTMVAVESSEPIYA